MKPISICTFLWSDPDYKGPRYEPAHVRAWARMISAHLSMPHETVVITDQPDADYGPCRVVPLWSFPELPMWIGGSPNCYRRLKLWDRETALSCGLDRWAWVDLDLVVFDALDVLFDVPEDFRILARPFVSFSHDYFLGWPQGGLVYQAHAGCRQYVWDLFASDMQGWAQKATQWVGNDQAIFQLTLSHDEAVWTSADGIWLLADLPAVKERGKPRLSKDGTKWKKGKKVRTYPKPANARIVFAHGWTNKPWALGPDEAERFPWFADEWLKYADA